jgi:hypothetical protein
MSTLPLEQDRKILVQNAFTASGTRQVTTRAKCFHCLWNMTGNYKDKMSSLHLEHEGNYSDKMSSLPLEHDR